MFGCIITFLKNLFRSIGALFIKTPRTTNKWTVEELKILRGYVELCKDLSVDRNWYVLSHWLNYRHSPDSCRKKAATLKPIPKVPKNKIGLGS